MSYWAIFFVVKEPNFESIWSHCLLFSSPHHQFLNWFFKKNKRLMSAACFGAKTFPPVNVLPMLHFPNALIPKRIQPLSQVWPDLAILKVFATYCLAKYLATFLGSFKECCRYILGNFWKMAFFYFPTSGHTTSLVLPRVSVDQFCIRRFIGRYNWEDTALVIRQMTHW